MPVFLLLLYPESGLQLRRRISAHDLCRLFGDKEVNGYRNGMTTFLAKSQKDEYNIQCKVKKFILMR
ncbi:hypothetical protein HMPREF1250_1642 [Megasphaera vaginalis (ex Srinivasan et al. 2021)]|uniref:Uncharacterized protein n=1 Tax=Megasphaera vaginalis (ex Srinivasan et al. 2021) TaxID=1111454 RepID=U7UD20_9FIRM|nr:hypothetical protein HMPREF1250_1642 [Megasphaera vaginalis (ex Srinivasan et al. 2021)]